MIETNPLIAMTAYLLAIAIAAQHAETHSAVGAFR